jgi:hypothetical protein
MAWVRTQNVSGNNSNNPSTSISRTITAPAVGSLIVTAVAIDKSSGTLTTPSGFTLLNNHVATDVSGGLAYKVSDGTETTVVWSWVTSHEACSWVGVYTGLSSTPEDAKAEANSGSSAVTSQTSGTTAAIAGTPELGVAVMAADTANNVFTGRAWSNGFAEIAFEPGDNGVIAGMSISEKNIISAGTVETTFSTTDSGDQLWVSVATFKEVAVVSRLKTLALTGVGL